ncbi:MAG: hypothetical protein V1723_03725 [Candidatus Uhrbacteria bacterium]
MRVTARILSSLVGVAAAAFVGACGSDEDISPIILAETPDTQPRRATITDAFDVTVRSVIRRVNGTIEDVGEDELFIGSGNRVLIYMTVQNRSDGWAPVNFELCVDHADLLDAIGLVDPTAALDPESAFEDQAFKEPAGGGPCVVRFEIGRWLAVEQGKDVEEFVGGVKSVGRPGGGYITIYFRVDFEKAGVLDLYEYTVPYRTMPGP